MLISKFFTILIVLVAIFLFRSEIKDAGDKLSNYIQINILNKYENNQGDEENNLDNMENNYFDSKILEEITSLKNAKISNFDLDRKLTEAIIKFESFKDKYDDLEANEVFIKTNLQINEANIDLEACKNYYNDIVTNYNKKVKQFPSDVIAKISKFKVRPYFDGKNMFDDNIKDFKL